LACISPGNAGRAMGAMIDAAGDLLVLAPQVEASGIAISSAVVYTGTGGAGAKVATAAYVSALQAMGYGVLACFNDATVDSGSATNAGEDGTQAVRQLSALSVPKGCAVAYDIERVADSILTGPYIVGVAQALLAADWIPLLYVSGFDPRFGQVFDEALALDYGTMAKCLFWLASWKSVGPPPAPTPDWSDPKGPAGLPWQKVHQDQVAAWQYAGVGTFDLSIVRAPLDTLLWRAPAPAPGPVPGSDADLQAQVASLRQQLAAANARSARLVGVLQSLARQADAAASS
jgi:hypothetical protein